MSMKVTGGFRVVGSNAVDVLRSITSMEDKIVDMQTTLLTERIADRFCREFDGDSKYTIDAVYEHFMKSYVDYRTRHSRFPFFDVQVDIACVEYEGSVYGRMICEQDSLSDLIMKACHLESYDYTDAISAPDDLGEEEWATRDKVWNAIYDGEMMQFTSNILFFDQIMPPCDPQRLLASVPSRDVRADRLACDRIVFRFVGEVSKDTAPDVHLGVSEAVFKALDYMKTDEGKAEVAKLKSEIEPSLHVFSEDDFVSSTYVVPRPK